MKYILLFSGNDERWDTMNEAERNAVYEQIGAWARVGDAFSIVKAALALCGFHPQFQGPAPYRSLRMAIFEKTSWKLLEE